MEKEGFTLPEPIYRLRFDSTVKNLMDASGLLKADLQEGNRPKVVTKKDVTETPEIVEQTLNVSPNMHIEEKVTQERAQGVESDLLYRARPAE